MDSQRILSGVSEEFETSSRSKIFVGVDSVDDRAHQSASNVKVSDKVHRISHDKEMNRVQLMKQKQLKRQLFFWPRERHMCSIVQRKKEGTKNCRDSTSQNSNFENIKTQPCTAQNTTDVLQQKISPSSFF